MPIRQHWPERSLDAYAQPLRKTPGAMSLLAAAMLAGGSIPWRPPRVTKRLRSGMSKGFPDNGAVSGMGPPTSGLSTTAGLEDSKLSARRAAKQQVRKEQTRAQGRVPSHRVLQNITVTPRTRSRYDKHIEEFLKCNPRISDVLLTPDAALDTATNAYVHQLFFDGLGVNLAKTTVYALLWKRSQKIWSLPLTRHALQGFATQDPDAVRDPATWPLVLLMAEHMAKHFDNGALLAAFILLAFDTYARVGELLRSSASWLIPPSASGSHGKWALIFFPSDQNMKSKTKQQDDTVIIGDLQDRAWLNSIAGAVHRRAFPHRRLFPLVYPDVLKACKKAFAEVGCSGEVMCPHRLRHGGASVDALQGKPSTYIKHRGRWTSSKSVSRYMKHGRYLRMMSLLSEQQRSSSRKSEQWLKKHFIKQLK